MTINELRDKAYHIATGNCMLEYYSYEEFNALKEIPTGPDAWEPFEYWEGKMIAEHVNQIAEDIISTFKKDFGL